MNEVIALILEIVVVSFLLLFLFSNFHSALSGAPYVPISRKLIHRLLAFGGLRPGESVCDLGCGDARVLIAAVRDFGVARSFGYEVGLWPYLKSRLLISLARTGNIVTVVRQNAVGRDIQGISFVFMYLFPGLVDRLASTTLLTLGSGAKILSAGFPIDTEKHPEFSLLKSEKIATINAYLYERA